MSYPTKSLSTHMRAVSGPTASTASQSPVLVARIEEKKAELERLRELRDLSAAVAGQMGKLEEKLRTLSDGTEAMAAVMSNWHNVLRAINMASSHLSAPSGETTGDAGEHSVPLPQTLVRIPTELAPTLQAQADALEGAAADDVSMASV